MTEEEVEDRCSNLARSGNLLLECEPSRWPDGTVCACYRFVHDIIQEVLYERIPAGRRARLHGRIGDRLEVGFGSHARNRAAELAGHFVEARAIDKAVEYLLLAAHQSLRRFAQVEGIGHLNRGLKLLDSLSEDRDRLEAELSFQSALAPAMIAQEGFGSKGAEAAFRRARELAEQLDDHDQHLAMIYGLAIQHELRGNFETSQQLMEERLQLQQRVRNDMALEVENYDLLACSLYHQAGYAESLEISQEGMKAFDERRHSAIASRFGENPGIACFSWAGLNLWFLGSPQRALEFSQRAVTLASEPGQQYHLSNAKMQLALLRQLRQEIPQTEQEAEATIAQAVEQGWVIPVAEGRLLKGWARVKSGDDSGFVLLQEGLDSLDALGAGMDRPYFLGLMADGLGSIGNFEEGIEVVDKALGLIHPSRSHFYQSELFRLYGQLLLGLDSPDAEAAERWYLRSLELARSQRARSIELRTATSLARLWAELERPREAGELLSKVVDSFEEGYDLPDLTAAGELLQELDALPA